VRASAVNLHQMPAAADLELDWSALGPLDRFGLWLDANVIDTWQFEVCSGSLISVGAVLTGMQVCGRTLILWSFPALACVWGVCVGGELSFRLLVSLQVEKQAYYEAHPAALVNQLDAAIVYLFCVECLVRVASEGSSPWRYFTGEKWFPRLAISQLNQPGEAPPGPLQRAFVSYLASVSESIDYLSNKKTAPPPL
jgi:hypothetical protein